MNAHRILTDKYGRFTAYVGLLPEVIRNVDPEFLSSVFESEKWANDAVEITFSVPGKSVMSTERVRERIGVEKRGWNLTEQEQELHWLGWYYPGGCAPTLAEVQSDVRNVIDWFESFIEVV